jgi:hypothetical protein
MEEGDRVNRTTALLTLVVIALVGGVGGLFWVQNQLRTTQLSLNLGFAAWELAQPVQVPALVAIAAGVGFAVGAVVFGGWAASASRRAARAESQLAVQSAGSGWGSARTGDAQDAAGDGWK